MNKFELEEIFSDVIMNGGCDLPNGEFTIKVKITDYDVDVEVLNVKEEG